VKPRLLVLDDDHHILALLRAYFGGLGWHVEACAEATTGLQLADSDAPFDAVICDLQFTGAAGAGIREEALRRGADDVVPKPAPLARLRDATLRAMKKP
jgi:CheY-like chemotaxis protein